MCGIVGFIDPERHLGTDDLHATVAKMAEVIAHRGPDGAGTWTDPEISIGLGHRRLAIIDLSPAGHQPMVSSCGRYVLVYNGEIYNYRALRRELESECDTPAPAFRGHSDTEVMLEAISRWGLKRSLERFNGMFAFALWDRHLGELSLARDRLGEKPVYYGFAGKTFLFASELKALKRHPRFSGRIDREALTLYLRFGFVPAPYSIYRGINKLPPGGLLKVDVEWLERGGKFSPFPSSVHDSTVISPHHYWSPTEVSMKCARNCLCPRDEEAAVSGLETLLRDAVRLRMEADVPLGAFLSGGVDSSTIVALMQAQSDKPAKTFSIGFYEVGMNEAGHAKAVAEHLHTEHVELYVTPEKARLVIPLLPNLFDEPFADPSQIPTFLVSLLAREHVKVSLSGDGGDELFCGYERYFMNRNLWRIIGWAPSWLRRGGGRALGATPERLLDFTLGWLAPFIKKYGNIDAKVGKSLHALSEVMGCRFPEEIYLEALSQWRNPTKLTPGISEPMTAYSDSKSWEDVSDFTKRMMFRDAVVYLPDDILVKVDRATMGTSLEAREPLLDHRVVEFAWRTPMSMKLRNGQSKWLLRQVLAKYVPTELVDRPKMGFGVPIGVWLRGPLRDWAEELLDSARLNEGGLLSPGPIREKWSEHLAGVQNWEYPLWNILMFQAWREAQRPEGGAEPGGPILQPRFAGE